jgi:hypothetical protein
MEEIVKKVMERKFIGEETYPVFQREREEGAAVLAFPSFTRSSLR